MTLNSIVGHVPYEWLSAVVVPVFKRVFQASCVKEKGKEAYLYSAFYILCISQSAQA